MVRESHFRTHLGHGSSVHALWRRARRGFGPRPLQDRRRELGPLGDFLVSGGGAPPPAPGLAPARSAPRACGGRRAGARPASRAAAGPPAVSIVLTPSPLVRLGRRAPAPLRPGLRPSLGLLPCAGALRADNGPRRPRPRPREDPPGRAPENRLQVISDNKYPTERYSEDGYVGEFCHVHFITNAFKVKNERFASNRSSVM